MSEENAQKKKVVVLCAAVICMSAAVNPLANHHPYLMIAWLGLMVVALVFAFVEFVKWRRNGK